MISHKTYIVRDFFHSVNMNIFFFYKYYFFLNTLSATWEISSEII